MSNGEMWWGESINMNAEYFIIAIVITIFIMQILAIRKIESTRKQIISQLNQFQIYYYETTKKTQNIDLAPPKGTVVTKKPKKGTVYAPSRDLDKTMGDGQEELFD